MKSIVNFQLQKHCETSLDDWLSSKISKKLSEKPGTKDLHPVPFHGIILFVSAALKGDIDEKVEVIIDLCVEKESESRHIITAPEITKVMTYQSKFKCLNYISN